MKFNQLLLVIPSLFVLALIVWHIVKYRGMLVAYYFLLFGLFFGFMRAEVIYYIQVIHNCSMVPYFSKNNFLTIGRDSLQVYFGWIIVAYLSWCLAEIWIRRYRPEKENQIFPIISLSFICIASFSYAIESTASFMGWWQWNKYIEMNLTNSLFIKTPWAGIIDWALVSFDFLAIFFILRYSYFSKKLVYLSFILIPLLHWTSHLQFKNMGLGLFYSDMSFLSPYSKFWHLIMPLFALAFFFIKKPVLDSGLVLKHKKKTIKNEMVTWASFLIIFAVCLFSDIFIGKNWYYLISLFPLITISIFLIKRIDFFHLFLFVIFFLIVTFLLPLDMLTKQRLALSIFPAYFLLLIEVVEKLKDFIKEKKSI